MLMAKSLSILCFGDSLTAGYTKSGAWYHPYAVALESSLQNALPSINVTVDVQGLSGDQVISPPGGFLPRMDILYDEVDSKTPYDFAFILGGTNDLFMSRLPNAVFASLQKVWDFPLQHGTKVVALTVPESGDAPSTIVKRRDMLNSLILNHQAEDFFTFDLHAAVPYSAMPEDERKEIWDDPVHFTAKGYDRVGRLLADRLLELLPTDVVAEGNKQELKKREHQVIGEKRGILRSGRSFQSAASTGT